MSFTPSSALATLRPDLGGSLLEYDLASAMNGFIAARVFAVIESATAFGPFGRFTLGALLQDVETRRAPGGNYGRVTAQFEPDTFATSEHGIEEAVDENEARMYQNYFQAELLAAARARFIVASALEKRVAAALFDATAWSAHTTGITHEWDDATNAVPITDIATARQTVWDASGMYPNALVINRKVFNNLRETDQIVERLKYNGTWNPSTKPSAAALADLFDLEELVIADSAKNTADEGQTPVIAPIWSDEYAQVCKIARTGDIREACVGRVVHWGEDGSQLFGAVETYRSEERRSDVVRVRNQTAEKVMLVAAGHLLSNITT